MIRIVQRNIGESGKDVQSLQSSVHASVVLSCCKFQLTVRSIARIQLFTFLRLLGNWSKTHNYSPFKLVIGKNHSGLILEPKIHYEVWRKIRQAKQYNENPIHNSRHGFCDLCGNLVFGYDPFQFRTL